METRSVTSLQHVFVARDDHHLDAGLLGAARNGADHVVGFEAGDTPGSGIRMASRMRRMYGICSPRSGGISVRLALYSANSAMRATGAPLSKTAAMYSGS